MAAIMSENSSSSKTILRVKRKRSEDPADLLLVSHAFKKSFKEQHIQEGESKPVQRIFRLAGTVGKSDQSLSPDILHNLKGNHRSKVKANPQTNLTVESINEKLRETKQLASQKSRYKVISKNRENYDDSTSTTPEIEDTDATNEMTKLFEMYDAVLDEVQPAGKTKEKNGGVDENAILCNSVKMIREKLTIDDEQTKKLDHLEKDYVYDVYCAEDSYGALSEMLDIVRLNQCELIQSEIDDKLERYDDEDDSNDEDNWRNDYPDEEEWSQSSDEEPRYKSKNFDYGWQDPDEYDGEYGRKMFSDNLSSDEEKDYAYFGQQFGESGGDKDEYSFEIVDEDD